MRNKIIILLMLVLMVSVVSADESFVFQEHFNYTLELTMAHANLSTCTDCSCTYSLYYPNGTVLVQDVNGVSSRGYCSYTNFTNFSGIYGGEMVFNDSLDFGRVSFEMEVNPTGVKSSEMKSAAVNRGIYVLFGIAFLLFMGFLFTPKEYSPFKWTFFLLSILFIVIGINIIGISIKSEAVSSNIVNVFDQLGAVSYYLYWFIGGLLLFIWILTTIASLVDKKNMKQAQAVGEYTTTGGFYR